MATNFSRSRAPTRGGTAPQYESERNKRPYTNRDGPGNTTIDYGPRKGSQQDSFDQKREKYGNSPWFGDQGNPLPWSGPDGQQVGQRTPFYTPSSLDPRNAGYWQGGQPDLDWDWDGDTSGIKNYMGFTDADMLELREDPAFMDSANAFMQARHSGNTKAAVAAMTKLKQSARPTGGTGNPAPSGNYQYGPGRPGPTPPGVSRGGASGGGGAPPQRGPIEIQGYQPSGGGGGFPRGGMGTGVSETRSMYDNPTSAQGGRTPPWGPDGGFNPPSFDRFPPGTPPFNVGGGGGGRPIDFENPTGGQPWNGPQQQFRPGQFQGQMPIERMGGMQQFGYRPTGGGY